MCSSDLRVKDVLHAVDHGRPVRAFQNVHDAFEAEDVVAAVLGERFEKQRQRRGPDRFLAQDRIGFDLGMDVGFLARMRVSKAFLSFSGLLRQPRMDVSRLGLWIIETRIEEAPRIDPPMIGNEHRCAGIERRKTAEQGGFGRPGQIQFSQDDPVGDGNLLL